MRWIITEQVGRKRFKARNTPRFATLSEAQQYLSECPNAYSWGWEIVQVGKRRRHA